MIENIASKNTKEVIDLLLSDEWEHNSDEQVAVINKVLVGRLCKDDYICFLYLLDNITKPIQYSLVEYLLSVIPSSKISLYYEEIKYLISNENKAVVGELICVYRQCATSYEDRRRYLETFFHSESNIRISILGHLRQYTIDKINTLALTFDHLEENDPLYPIKLLNKKHLDVLTYEEMVEGVVKGKGNVVKQKVIVIAAIILKKSNDEIRALIDMSGSFDLAGFFYGLLDNGKVLTRKSRGQTT